MSRHGKRRRWTARTVVLGLVVAGLGTFGISSAQAVHLEEFQLDTGAGGANTVDNAASAQDFDWESFFAGPGDIHSSVTLPDASRPNFLASGGAADYALPDFSTYATGSKDTLPIAGGWQCSKSNNVGDKVDIVNSYATAYLDTSFSPPHLILYYGVEKSSPNGDSNIAVWFLKDGTVDCANTGGGAKNWTGHHVDGDILLVSAFTNGGTQANVNAYEWQGDDTGSLSTTPMASGQLCGTGSDEACSVVNTTAITPPWNHPDKNGGALDTLEFFEGGVDAGPFGAETCFATAVANTRSSQSLTATLFDFDRFSLPVCGKLEVQKYIDVDLSGTSNTGDVTSGTAVSGWSFSVNGPGAAGPVVCSGTTGTDGKLTCGAGQSLSNLTPGTYTITETQKTGFFNTDAADNSPDPNINESTTTVVGTFTLGVSGGTVKFGNTCYVDKTFQINNVPAALGTIKVDWTVASGTHSGATGTETLTGTTTRTATVSDKFNQLDSLDWSWYLASDPANKVVGGTGDSLSGGAYPSCADTNQANFAGTDVSGLKYKDVDDNGDRNAGDLPGAGFTFDLYAGLNPAAGATPLQTAVSDSAGNYSFATKVAPGDYTIRERQETGWIQTEPASNADRTITVVLGQASATVGDFGNHPLSKLDVSLTSLAKNPGTTTDATKAQSITCKPSGGSNLTDTDADANDFSATNLHIRTYECTVVVIDP